MVKLSQLKPDRDFYKGWRFVGLCAVALTIAVFISRGGWSTVQSGLADSNDCRVQVSASEVRVRAAPDPNAAIVDLLRKDQVSAAQREVQAGFRKLAEGRWAWEQFLIPSNC